MNSSQVSRILAFDNLVRQGKYPNSVCFSVDYEVSQRTVLRDIAYLKDQLGAPLEYDVNRLGFYYTQEWHPPLLFSLVAREENRVATLLREIEALNQSDRTFLVNKLQSN